MMLKNKIILLMIYIYFRVNLLSKIHNLFSFLQNYDNKASGSVKAETLFDHLKQTQYNLLKNLEKSIRQKSNKKGGA